MKQAFLGKLRARFAIAGLVASLASSGVFGSTRAASSQGTEGRAGGEVAPRLADSTRDRMLRDAKTLLRAGNYDAAIQLLERLFASNPDDPAVVPVLSSALIEAKRYDRAEAVLKSTLEKHPLDPKSLSDLATLYLVTGRKQDGLAYLDKMIAIAPKEPWTYQMAFLVLSQNGAPEDAVGVVARARKATGDSTLLAEDLARVLRDLARYDAATLEYLVAGEAERDPGLAVDGLVGMAEKPEARKAVTAKLDAAAASKSHEAIARSALWQIYLMDGDCERAFSEISTLARSAKLSPDELDRFVVQSQAKGCSRHCAEVYGLALGLPGNKADYPRLMLSQAECELRSGLPDQAIVTYGAVASRYRDSKWACQAEVALAKIYRDQGKLDQAITQADQVIGAKSAGDAKYEAILFKGDCQVRAGNLDEAFKTYDLAGTDWKPAYAQEAFYNMGEIRLYEGNVDDATSYYNVTLRQYPEETRANDAVGRLLLLKGVKGDLGTMWLKEFAQAELLRRQGRTDEAVGLFTKRAGETGAGPIKIESLKELARLAVERGDFETAIKTYRVIGDSLDNYYSPSALEAIGDVYLQLGKAPQAIQAYEDVILKFPQSVSAGEARRKIDVAKRETQGEATGRPNGGQSGE